MRVRIESSKQLPSGEQDTEPLMLTAEMLLDAEPPKLTAQQWQQLHSAVSNEIEQYIQEHLSSWLQQSMQKHLRAAGISVEDSDEHINKNL